MSRQRVKAKPATRSRKNPLIENRLGQLAEKGLFGRPYVQDYLYDLSLGSNSVKSCRSRSIPILFPGHSCPSTFPDLKTSHFPFDISLNKHINVY